MAQLEFALMQNSFSKVGADQIWNTIITKYNSIPLVNDVNPDLTDYVTQEALKGVYTMISVEEKLTPRMLISTSKQSTKVLKVG